ncbi:MAG: hypothetical protein S4CHLAM102_00570 [Chlamydiia bacterium]|nr:hypothetical protein [Chlamydiia bacterium]
MSTQVYSAQHAISQGVKAFNRDWDSETALCRPGTALLALIEEIDDKRMQYKLKGFDKGLCYLAEGVCFVAGWIFTAIHAAVALPFALGSSVLTGLFELGHTAAKGKCSISSIETTNPLLAALQATVHTFVNCYDDWLGNPY